MLQLYLFGPMRLINGEQSLTLAGARMYSLLACLALSPSGMLRERLADLLWPDALPERSRRLLSDALYDLRRVIGSGRVIAAGRTVRLSGCWCDVAEFDRLIRSGDPDSLVRALALYTDDLLPDLYDEWVLAARLERREAYLSALETLVQFYRNHDDLPTATHYAQQLVSAEPLREENQQTYLRLLGRLGRRNEVLEHYNRLAELLQRELGVPPLPETQVIIDAIRRETGGHTALLPESEAWPFVGRTSERERLITGLEQALGGQGTVIALEGEAGIGKSRLLQETIASARWRGLLTLSAGAPPTPHDPLLPLREALHGLSTLHLHVLEQELPPPIRAVCGEFIPIWRDDAALVDLPPTQRLAQQAQAIQELFEVLTHHVPVCLLIDDLHYSLPDLWPLLDTLVTGVRRLPCCIILAYRRTAMQRHPAWERLDAWERARFVRVLALEPLTLEDTAHLIPLRYRADHEYLFGLSAGNPFRLIQAVTVLEEGHSPDTPMLERVAELPLPIQAALHAAAVLGMEAFWTLWAGVAQLTNYVAVAETLVQRRFLRPTAVGYRFAHELVQRALYDGLPPDERRMLHQRVAATLAVRSPDDLAGRAWHHDRAGESRQAVELYLRLSKQYHREAMYGAARDMLRHAFDLTLPHEPTAFAILLDLIYASFIVDEGEHLGDLIDQALHLARISGNPIQQARAALAAGEWAVKNSLPEMAHMHLQAAHAYATISGDLALQADTFNQLGELALRQGDHPAARARWEQQRRIAQQLGDHEREAAALEGIGFALANSGGASTEVLAYLERALALRCTLGNRFKEAQSRLNLLSAL